MNFDLDIAIIAGFLILNLAVGLFYGRGIKNMKDYAIGNQKFNTSTLVATIVATWIGGSGFALSLSETYVNGIWYIFAGSGYAFNLLVVAYLFNKRIPEYNNSLSVAETMGKLYGQKVRIITAIASIASTIAVVALQIKVFSTIFSYFLGFSAIYATIISSIVVIIYSAFGGIKAVTFTDVVQFITFGVVTPIFALFIWKALANQDIFANAMYSELFNYRQLFEYNSEKSYKFISIFLAGLIPALNPTVFQRMLMATSTKQVRKSFLISSIVCLIVYLLTCLIGFVVYFHDNTLNPESLGLYVINNYSFAGIKSFAIIGVMAMIMSTADSWINTSSVIFAHDLCKPLGIKTKHELILSRYFAIFIGISVVILTLSHQYLLDLLFLSENFYIPLITPLLMLAILGVRSTSRVALISISSGIIMTIFWKNFIQPWTNIESVVPGMLANFTAFFIFHYLLEKKWPQNKKKKITRQLMRDKKISLVQKIRNFLQINSKNARITNLNQYLPVSAATYNYFAFAVFLTLITTFSIENSLFKENLHLINLFQAVVLCVALFFFCNGLWPNIFIEKYLAITWIISVFISLVVISSFLVLLSKFSHVSLTILTIHLTMVSLLLGWRTSLIIIPVGLTLSFVLYEGYVKDIVPHDIQDSKMKLMYLLFIVVGFSITLLRSGQEHLEATEAKVENLETEITHLDHEVDDLHSQVNQYHNQVTHYNEKISDQEKEIERLGATAQKILNNVNHELRLPVGNVMNFSEMLYQGLEKHTPEMLKELSDQVYKNTNRLSTMILNMLDLANLEVKKVNLEKTPINFSEMVKNRVTTCRNIYLQGKPISFKLMIDPEIMISVDPNYMRQAIDNLVINAINFSENGTIIVRLEKQNNTVLFTITDQGIGIPSKDIFDIFTPFKMGSNTESKAEGRGVGLALCKSIIEAHDGKIGASSKGEGATFRFVLPR
jgi:Na+/proline symporter/signal transduction histidine kinase